MQVAQTVAQMRALAAQVRQRDEIIGLVPTMGALHAGHTSLIDQARSQCNCVVVSVFVNPTQFGPAEDFKQYPRPFEKDLAICERYNVDVVFAPPAEEMYPVPSLTWVTVQELTEPLCGRSRPGHFRGVTTVCTKLFNITQPHFAYFGQKDAQQALVIERMVADLNMPVEIVVCPIVREEDGLAISSRNQYLDEQQRKDATVLYRALSHVRTRIKAGRRDVRQLVAEMRGIMEQVPSVSVEYVSIVDSATLAEVKEITGRVLIAVAAAVGPTRLIDNILVDVPSTDDTMKP